MRRSVLLSVALRRILLAVMLVTTVACGSSSESSPSPVPSSAGASGPQMPGGLCGSLTCSAGQKCIVNSGVQRYGHCATQREEGAVCMFFDYAEDDCRDGLHCDAKDLTCHGPKAAGVACDRDASCLSLHCYAGVCEPGSAVADACTDTSCGGGTYCEHHKNPASCLPQSANGAACTRHAECLSTVCCVLKCQEDAC